MLIYKNPKIISNSDTNFPLKWYDFECKTTLAVPLFYVSRPFHYIFSVLTIKHNISTLNCFTQFRSNILSFFIQFKICDNNKNRVSNYKLNIKNCQCKFDDELWHFCIMDDFNHYRNFVPLDSVIKVRIFLGTLLPNIMVAKSSTDFEQPHRIFRCQNPRLSSFCCIIYAAVLSHTSKCD